MASIFYNFVFFLIFFYSWRLFILTCLTAYEKKYGTEVEREARREAQALARVKAMAERESMERDEQKQLMEVIKASLAEVSYRTQKYSSRSVKSSCLVETTVIDL